MILELSAKSHINELYIVQAFNIVNLRPLSIPCAKEILLVLHERVYI